MKTVRLIWLEAFVLVAKSRSFKEAGEKMDVDPTVIKKYISSLESWLDKKLIYSSDRKVATSADGLEFLPKAETIIELLHTSRDFKIGKDNLGDVKYISQFFAKHMHKSEN
jgi:DNA-binding transcriptional LysR family regulator